MQIPNHILEYANDFLSQNIERDSLNEQEDYDGAFEVECSQRDNGSALAEFILELNLAQKLESEEEITFTHNDKFIYIQKRVDEDYEGDIYDSEEAYNNEDIEPLDGGICESESALDAIEFFKDL